AQARPVSDAAADARQGRRQAGGEGHRGRGMRASSGRESGGSGTALRYDGGLGAVRGTPRLLPRHEDGLSPPAPNRAARQEAMNDTYTCFLDLAAEAQPPEKGILSRTLHNDDRLKAVLFGFAQDEELSEHTASMPAVLHFLRGEAKLTLGDGRHEAVA